MNDISGVNSDRRLNSVTEFIERIRQDSHGWDQRWFRGQSNDWPLIPSVLRGRYNEHTLLTWFQLRAPALGETPDLANLAEWLFLMQHHQVPTRLLDWTESALTALFFAFYSGQGGQSPCVWMLDPYSLNELNNQQRVIHQPWSRAAEEYFLNIVDPRSSFDSHLPLAISALHRYRRMSSQQSCFTVHGVDPEPIEEQTRRTLVEKSKLIRYDFCPEAREDILADLKVLGVTCSLIFPDFDGLAREIRAEFE